MGTYPAEASVRPGARRPWGLFVLAVGFAAVLVSPYLLLNIGDSRLTVSGYPQYDVLVAHVFSATIALVLGPLQFVPRVRVHRRVHRVIGRCYLFAGVLPAALTAVPVALMSGHLLTVIGLVPAALGWLLTGWLALRAIRRDDWVTHRRWMMRNYALTFLAVTSRLLVPLLLLAQIPFTTTDRAALVQTSIPIGQSLGWIINLLVVEVLLRRGRPPGAAATSTGGSAPASANRAPG